MLAELNSDNAASQLEARREDVRRLAAKLWYEAEPTSAHEFFTRYHVSAQNLRRYRGPLVLEGQSCDGCLLIPMIDDERILRNLSFVREDGQRKYLATDCIEGTYWSIGKIAGDGTIVVTSGVLKGLQLRQQLSHAIAVSFTNLNIPKIAALMRSRYSLAQILIARSDESLAPYDGQSCQGGETPLPPRAIAPLRQLIATPVTAQEKGTDESTEDFGNAKKLLAWLARRRLQEFYRKDVLQKGPSVVRPVAHAKAALATLVEFGWLQTENDNVYQLTSPALRELNLADSTPFRPIEASANLASGGDPQAPQQKSG